MKLSENKPFQLKQLKGTIVDIRDQTSWNFTEKNIIRIEVESGNRKLFYEVNDEFNQNKKLRELIEKRIDELIEEATTNCEKVVKMDAGFYCDCECCGYFGILQKLLEESKNEL